MLVCHSTSTFYTKGAGPDLSSGWRYMCWYFAVESKEWVAHQLSHVVLAGEH